MNIALINPEHPSLSGQGHGGIATYVYTMANALCDAGQKVHVLVRKGTVTDSLNKSVELHTFHNTPVAKPFSFLSRRFNSKIYWEMGCSKAAFDCILKLHNKSPLDVVEIPEYNGIASQFIQPLPFSLVINFHTPTVLIDELNLIAVTRQRKKWYTYEKNALRNATAFRCPSKSLQYKLNDIFSIQPDQVTVIHNPIPTYSFEVIKKKETSANGHCEILFSGRLERRKGAEIILQAINTILDINKNIHITFAGETEIGESAGYRQAIERILDDEKRSRTWFLGPMERDKLSLLYRRSDVFLIPSLFENSPYTLLEAMAARLPIVGADTGGINEIIDNNKTGLLFSLNSIDEFYNCIKVLVSSPKQGVTLAQNAYEYLTKNYNPETIAQQTIEFYNSIVKRKETIT